MSCRFFNTKKCDWVGEKPFKRCLKEGIGVSTEGGGGEVTAQFPAFKACSVSCYSFNKLASKNKAD